MTRSIAQLFLIGWSFLSIGLAFDWKSEVANYLAQGAGFEQAAHYLEEQLASLTDEDKPVACGLLAFFFNRLGDREKEYQRLGEYFEKYGPVERSYEFLPLSVRNALILYLRDWILRYPWVLKIGFVESSSAQAKPAANSPPQQLILGIEMANEAYYKLSRGKEVLKGGQFKRGFNSLTIESDKFFIKPGTHSFVLELKAGSLVVWREVVVDVRLNVFGVLGNQGQEAQASEYILKMFLGDTLLALIRKTVTAMPRMKIETPPPSGVYDPWGPGYQNKPEIPNTFPILGIPALISELLKSLKNKDEIEPVPPVELRPDITLLYRAKNREGRNIEILARLSLGLKDIQFYPFGSSPKPS